MLSLLLQVKCLLCPHWAFGIYDWLPALSFIYQKHWLTIMKKSLMSTRTSKLNNYMNCNHCFRSCCFSLSVQFVLLSSVWNVGLLFTQMSQASVVKVQQVLMLLGTCRLLLTLAAENTNSDLSNVVYVVVTLAKQIEAVRFKMN